VRKLITIAIAVLALEAAPASAQYVHSVFATPGEQSVCETYPEGFDCAATMSANLTQGVHIASLHARGRTRLHWCPCNAARPPDMRGIRYGVWYTFKRGKMKRGTTWPIDCRATRRRGLSCRNLSRHGFRIDGRKVTSW
jgi:hypothetical protein